MQPSAAARSEVPTTAPSPIERIGERLQIWPPPPATFAAEAPFHIAGGYCLELMDLERLGWIDPTEAEAYAAGTDPEARVDFLIDGVQVATGREFVPPRGAAWSR